MFAILGGMAKKKLTRSQEIEAVTMYEAGDSAQKVAGHFKVHPVTLRTVLLRNNVPPRGTGGHRVVLPDETLQELEAQYLSGASCQELGILYGLGRTTVGRLLEARGVALRSGALGEKHGAWKGGKVTTAQGYILVRLRVGEPFAEMRDAHGYVMEHRLVVASNLGRALVSTETVHHIDGDRSNNTIENLQLRKGKHGKGSSFRCADCGSCNVSAEPLAERTAHS